MQFVWLPLQTAENRLSCVGGAAVDLRPALSQQIIHAAVADSFSMAAAKGARQFPNLPPP